MKTLVGNISFVNYFFYSVVNPWDFPIIAEKKHKHIKELAVLFLLVYTNHELKYEKHMHSSMMPFLYGIFRALPYALYKSRAMFIANIRYL